MHERIKMMNEAGGGKASPTEAQRHRENDFPCLCGSVGDVNSGSNLLDGHVFQFDFLNDSFDKLPADLKRIIDDPEERKRLVIYINPPYAEAGNAKQRSGTGQNKTNVSVTHGTYTKYLDKIGIAGRELFAQFFMRIQDEIPGCILGQFSTLKHLSGPNFKQFRQAFKATLGKSFIVPADTFDNVNGEFPIGFFVWRLCGNEKQTDLLTPNGVREEVSRVSGEQIRLLNKAFSCTVSDMYNRKGEFVGAKTLLSYDNEKSINDWLIETRKRGGEYIGFLSTRAHDFQDNGNVYIVNSKDQIKSARGSWISTLNLPEAGVFFAVRKCIEHTVWNHNDQFLWPYDGWESDLAFQSDCLVYMLFHDKNRISGSSSPTEAQRHGENISSVSPCLCGRQTNLNHWIPFTEEEVNAQGCFASHFMNDYLAGKIQHGQDARATSGTGVSPSQSDLFNPVNPENPVILSKNISVPPCENLTPAARAVLDSGRELWRYYHAQPGANPNASFYDIRLHFQGVKTLPSGKTQMNADSSDETYTRLLASLRAAHRALAAQIAPKVYDYGFLRK